MGHHFMRLLGLCGREGKTPDVIRCIQGAVLKVERWSHDWGFRTSLTKSCYVLFTRKRRIDVQLPLCGQNMERVSEVQIFRIVV